MSEGQNIQVFVRCRPLRSEEKHSSIGILPETNEVRLPQHAKEFYFDRVFSPDAPQVNVYNVVVRPLISQVLTGYNCSVFAYGQTGTGKTYTMEGMRSSIALPDAHSGLIPRAVSAIFDTLKDNDQEYSVKVSFLELYNEDAYDLLSPIDDTTKLKIFDDSQKKGSVIVGGLEEATINSKLDIYEILKRGSAKRQTTSTLLNACSSRSHTIFSVTLHIKENSNGRNELRIGKLNLVDLAGSENIARSGAQDKRVREAGNINQSLLTLGRVITALEEKRPHIPYRESKLTRILQDSLGGSTRTSMIATISPAEEDFSNTQGTLEYASRARCIINRPESCRHITQSKLSDIDLQSFKTKLRNDLEIEIRNEVSREFRVEVDKVRESYRKQMSEQDDNKARIITMVKEENIELRKRAVVLEQENSNLQKENGILQQENSNLQQENGILQQDNSNLQQENINLQQEKSNLQQENNNLRQENSELSRNFKIIQQLANDRQELNDKLRITFKLELDEKQAKIKELEDENAKFQDRLDGGRCDPRHGVISSNIENHLVELPEEEVKKASKVRKRAPIQEELNDYANMTFDGDDEIVQLSAKKARKGITAGGKKRELHKELTLSGKKKRLRSVEEDVELSPVTPPIRVTRSRATRRKLDY